MLFCSHLISCSAVQLPVTNQYRLQAFDTRALQSSPSAHRTLLISQPEAAEGYQTEQMLYVDKPFQLSAFAGNAWVSTPANMLFPLLIQSFQASRAFSAIASSPYPNQVDYRLDTQVIAMQQNFLTTPSQLELTLKIVLTHVKNNTILFSTILTETVTCTSDTPYGGVVAANQAIQTLTGKIKRQVIRAIKANESE
jgi:cholesterol transport system auxiliary component